MRMIEPLLHIGRKREETLRRRKDHSRSTLEIIPDYLQLRRNHQGL
jgi:hypothetical protein